MENISYMFHMFCFLCFSVNKDRVLCERQTHKQNTQNHTHRNRQMQKTAFFKQEHIQTHTTDRQRGA